MSSAYQQLLDATISHLEALRATGTRLVTVDPTLLAGLRGTARPGTPPTPPSRPATALGPTPARTAPPPANPVPVVTVPRPAGDKVAAMESIRQRALACQQCPHLASSRQHVVFGVGNPNATLMFVGEAPGADEDAQGEPFVGRAGAMLTGMIQGMGLAREEVYIANILKCRPDTPGQRQGNRKPTAEEMATCLPYLQEQIDLVQPRVLVALGGTAIEGLLQQSGISRLRGTWQTYRGIPLMPTFHPSYLLHREGDGKQGAMGEKRKVWEDLLQVMEKLGLPISEKQRRFFLPKPGA
ncbi:MAG: Type-4 uracil-DNA glycosylase [Verrucomicrobiota bacterium]|jgi:DNA polymerase